MTSKLEYLQRYMPSSGGDAAEGEKRKKKKVKKTKSAALGTRVVDADDAWEQSAPSREDIEKKWEQDAAEDEQPLVVAADGEQLVDPQDLPVYVDSDKYLDQFRGRKKQKEDEDLSPPRKKKTEGPRGRDSSEEASPPRRLKRERRSDAAKEPRGRGGGSGGDVSPPRKKRRGSDGDASPPRRGGQDEASPPRRRATKSYTARGLRGNDDDASPPRRGRDDVSPPRRVKKETESLVAERKSTTVKQEDVSPPRRSRRDERDSEREERKRRSPSRSPAVLDRQRRVDSLGRDIPPRSGRSERRSPSTSKGDDSKRCDRRITRSHSRSRGRGRDRGRDVSPSPTRRRGRGSRSRSPHSRRRRDSRSPSVHRQRSPRRSTRWESPRRRDSRRDRSRTRGGRRSASPSRRSRSRSNSPNRLSSRRESLEVKREKSPDNRDARQASRVTADSTPEKKITSEPSKRDDKNMKKESVKTDGKEEKKAGLFTATEFEAQRKIAARRKDILHGVDASEMGANAETVYRDKRGRKLDMLNEMVRQQEVLEGKRKREEREEYEWGTGEVQKRERKSQQELLEQMKKTPFSRHEDDEELERKRRERVRAFDPINSKTFQEDPLADEGKSKKKKSKKDKKKTSKAKPKYAGPPAPPNRFGIMPGYRWDGVVRGTNWEEKIMMRQNANAAVSEEAYKYAVADM